MVIIYVNYLCLINHLQTNDLIKKAEPAATPFASSGLEANSYMLSNVSKLILYI